MALEAGVLARAVGFARRAGIHALLGEGLLVGASTLMLMLCLGLHSGAEVLAFPGLFLGGLAGVMAATSWVKSGWLDRTRWARALDARLGLEGALLAGLNVERRGEGELGRLLTRRVQGQVRRQEILVKAVPLRLWLLGVLVISGSLLFHGLQKTQVPELRWQEATEVLGGLTEELKDAARRAQELPDGQVPEGVVQDLKALGAETQRMELALHLGQDEPEDWVQPLEEMGERLDRLARDLAGDRDLDQKMERAQGLLSAVKERAREQAGEEVAGEPAGLESMTAETGGSDEKDAGDAGTPSDPSPSAGEPVAGGPVAGGQGGVAGSGEDPQGGGQAGAGPSSGSQPPEGPSDPGLSEEPVIPWGAVAQPPRAYRRVLERWRAGSGE